MKRNVFLGTLFSAAFAVTVAGQTGSQPQGDQQSSRTQNQQQVTVTGCLSNADTAGATAGTSGTGTAGQATGTSRSEGQFMLTNAKVTSGGAGATGTSGTATGTATSATANNKFLLIGGNQTELKKYVNSEVEVRGTLQPRSEAGRTGAGTGTGTGSATGETARQNQSEMANVQRLRVTSVKQTAQTCTGGN